MTNLEKFDELTKRIRCGMECPDDCENCEYFGEPGMCSDKRLKDIKELTVLLIDFTSNSGSITFGMEEYKG